MPAIGPAAAGSDAATGKLAVAVAVVAVGTSAIMIMYAGSGPLTIAFYRLLFTTLMLVPFVAVYEREAIRNLDRRDLLRLAAVGLVLAAHFSLWIASVRMTTVANSVVLVTTHPLFVAGISALLLKEYSPRYAILGGVVAGIGVVVMFAGDLSTGGLLGDAMAFGGAIAAGTYIVAGRSERRKLPTGTYCIVVYAFTTIFLLPGAFLESHLVPAANLDWLLFLAMAAVPGIMGHTFYNYALGHVSAFLVSTSLLGEPVISSLLAAILFAQVPPALSLLGIPLVFAGIVLAAWASGNRATG
jgi:drug/metabolite transporter (DMT)-like permease